MGATACILPTIGPTGSGFFRSTALNAVAGHALGSQVASAGADAGLFCQVPPCLGGRHRGCGTIASLGARVIKLGHEVRLMPLLT